MGLYITITIGILRGGFGVLWRRLRMTIILICGMFIEVLDNISGPQSLYCKRITAWQMQAEPLPLFTVALPLGDKQALICRLRGIKLHLKFSDLSKEWPPLSDQLTLISTLDVSAGVNCKNRPEGASETFQMKCWGGLWVQRAVDMWVPACWAPKDPTVGLVKEGTADV